MEGFKKFINKGDKLDRFVRKGLVALGVGLTGWGGVEVVKKITEPSAIEESVGKNTVKNKRERKMGKDFFTTPVATIAEFIALDDPRMPFDEVKQEFGVRRIVDAIIKQEGTSKDSTNPGNIEYRNLPGQIYDNTNHGGRFAVYKTRAEGEQAIYKIVQNGYKKGETFEEFIQTYVYGNPLGDVNADMRQITKNKIDSTLAPDPNPQKIKEEERATEPLIQKTELRAGTVIPAQPGDAPRAGQLIKDEPTPKVNPRTVSEIQQEIKDKIDSTERTPSTEGGVGKEMEVGKRMEVGRRYETYGAEVTEKAPIKKEIFHYTEPGAKSPYSSYGSTPGPNQSPYSSGMYPDNLYNRERVFFPDISEEGNKIIQENPEFYKNPFRLTGERLLQACMVYHQNIQKIFNQNTYNEWQDIKNRKAAELLKDKKNTATTTKINVYLTKLISITELKPKTRETVDSYIIRALQKAAQNGHLNECSVQ